MTTDTIRTELPPVTLAGTTFQVAESVYSYIDAKTGEQVTSSDTWLTGPRGAEYFLRGFLGEDKGIYQVISWKSGQPLRKRGNEIRVVRLGDILEQATTAAERRRLTGMTR